MDIYVLLAAVWSIGLIIARIRHKKIKDLDWHLAFIIWFLSCSLLIASYDLVVRNTHGWVQDTFEFVAYIGFFFYIFAVPVYRNYLAARIIALLKTKPKPSKMFHKIQIEIGDIALQKADAIACLPNSTLSPIGAVASRIHKVAGGRVTLECHDLIVKFGAVPVGSVAVTSAGNLDAKYVFHAIGPKWHGGEAEAQLLASCYHECISTAEDMELESIAFPSIATGSGEFPLDKAAKIFSDAVNTELPNLLYLKQIKMVCADKKTFEAYSDALAISNMSYNSSAANSFDSLSNLEKA